MVGKIFLSFVFALLSLTVDVESAACVNSAEYSACSSNSECGCLPYSFSNSMGICGVILNNCSELIPCQSPNDACPQTGHVCVRHSRCDSRPLCYPLSMTDQTLCPQIIVSNYSSSLDIGDGTYTRPGSSSSGHYYEAFEIIADRTGTYDIMSTTTSNLDTHGYIYNGTFYPSSPSINLAAQDDDGNGNYQFKLRVSLQAGQRYILVVSDHSAAVRGSYSIVTSGPGNVLFTPINPIDLTTTTTTTTTTTASIIYSNYSSELSLNSSTYGRGGSDSSAYYYEAIEIEVATTGSYTFSSSSSIGDTYGYLYQSNFDTSSPTTNLIQQNDDGASNGQFRITATLTAGTVYVLVFTTYTQHATGTFAIDAVGPDNVFFNPINN